MFGGGATWGSNPCKQKKEDMEVSGTCSAPELVWSLITSLKTQSDHSLDKVGHGRFCVARHVNESLQMLRPPDGQDDFGI